MDQEFREVHTTWLDQKEKEEQKDVAEAEERKEEKEEDTMVTEVSAEVKAPVVFVPQEIERSEEQTTIRHDTFYFEDGNVEIMCEHTVFRVHSTIISFSSSKLRDILSSSTILNASMPEGCPRISFTDSAEDFGVLLKMIYIPEYVPLLNVGSEG